MSFFVRGSSAISGVIAAAVLAATPAAAKPDYIDVTPDALRSAFGPAVAKRAFSDELTERRKAMLRDELPGSPCDAHSKFALVETQPYKVDPKDVMWIERYNVACKEEVRRSLLIIDDGGKLKVIGLLPGTTGADPNLQMDAVNIVSGAAVTRIPNCDNVSISDTEMLEPPPAGGGPWKERWTVSGCEKSDAIDVNFTPSAQGGTDVYVVATK